MLRELVLRDGERGSQLAAAAAALEALAAQQHATQTALERLQSDMQQVAGPTHCLV